MGWFWSDASTSAHARQPPTVSRRDHEQPPPGCPMHSTKATSVVSQTPSSPSETSSGATSCPYAPPIPGMSSSSSSQPNTESRSESWYSRINPLNMMPSLPNAPTSSSQTIVLPLEREASSIPRGSRQKTRSAGTGGCPVKHSESDGSTQSAPYGDADGTHSDKWQYPSPQQMYNALLRKGYTDTDPSAVTAMVSVHNFLNEGAWAEILEWERRFHAGLATGWRISARGEENSCFGAMTELEPDGWRRSLRDTRMQLEILEQLHGGTAMEDAPEPELLRFEGRPQDRTPKSRILETLGRLFPKQYSASKPFDRHDWFVSREQPDGSVKEIRYVIDYYSGPDETTGDPTFFLDVRPAIDGPTSLGERLVRWSGDVWYRSSGAAVREKSLLEKKVQELREQHETERQSSRRRL